MKKLVAFACLCLLVTSSPSADAGLIIDDFTVGNQIFGTASSDTGTLNSGLGTFTYSLATSTIGADFNPNSPGNTTATLPNLGDTLMLTYNFTAPLDLTIVGVNNALKLDLFDVVNGEYQIDVSYTSGASPAVAFASRTIISPGPIYFDNNTNAAASSIDVIQILLTTITLPTAAPSFRAFGASISAVPEPTSMVLLGLTAAGGGLAFRRKKKVGAAAIAV